MLMSLSKNCLGYFAFVCVMFRLSEFFSCLFFMLGWPLAVRFLRLSFTSRLHEQMRIFTLRFHSMGTLLYFLNSCFNNLICSFANFTQLLSFCGFFVARNLLEGKRAIGK